MIRVIVRPGDVMPAWLKVILVILGILAVALGAGSFLTYRWLGANRARLIETGKELRVEGGSFGKGKTAAACIDESLRRLHAASGFQGESKARLFLSGCLSVATADPAFCEAVPRQSETIAAAEWTVNECRSRDAAEIPRCSRVFQEVVNYCDTPKQGRP
jgi:hypothetical protein